MGGMPIPTPMPPGQKPQGNVIKVVLRGPVASPFGRTAVASLASARGIALAAVIDPSPGAQGRDVGELAGFPEPLELPVVSDVIMVLASIAQARSTGVYVDFTGDASSACENVRQATAFGLASVIVGGSVPEEDIGSLFEFCDKASTGCVVAPQLSVTSLLLERAAAQIAFHCSHAQIVEARGDGAQAPSDDALRLAQQLTQIGKTFNGANEADSPALGQLLEEGVRVHSLQQPGVLHSMDVRLGGPGQLTSLKVDVTSHKAYMAGLLLAIRRAPRLKGLVYGLEKLL